MDDEPAKRELSMDELDEARGTGPILPPAQHGGQVFFQTAAHRRFGIVDDSV